MGEPEEVKIKNEIWQETMGEPTAAHKRAQKGCSSTNTTSHYPPPQGPPPLEANSNTGHRESPGGRKGRKDRQVLPQTKLGKGSEGPGEDRRQAPERASKGPTLKLGGKKTKTGKDPEKRGEVPSGRVFLCK